MAQCEVCGNEYNKSFELIMNEKSHMFDCFECAIHALAPTCEHCNCRIVGHGVEAGNSFYCCAHCATKEGVVGIQDHA
jgi:phage terminase large subunit GpA-like protein